MSDLFWNTGQKFGIHLLRVSLLLLEEFKDVQPDSSFKVLPYEERLKELNPSSHEDPRKFNDNVLLFKGSWHVLNFILIIPNKCNTNIFKLLNHYISN